MTEVKKHQAKPEEVLILTLAAKQHFLNGLAKQPKAIGVRFSLKKTGCSGLSYVIEYVDTADKNDLTLPLCEQYQLFVDSQSYSFIKGMTVDYVKDNMGSKLVFLNPNQKGQCGCGESFSV